MPRPTALTLCSLNLPPNSGQESGDYDEKLFLAFLLLFASSIAYSDDITEWGEVVSVDEVSQGSDAVGPWTGRVTFRANGVDSVFLYGTGYCQRTYGNIVLFRDLLMAPYLRVRFRTKPAENIAGFTCIVGVELTNEKFLVP
jgi:hypothetical protein